jgi:prepilin-type N-terminal cleavage/methylation domain-containing protein
MRIKGFTLLELLIGLTVCGFLLFSGLVSWSQWRQKNERQLLINEIKTAIHYAKIQAISYGRPLLLSSKNSNHDWSKGMNLTLVQRDSKQLLHQWGWENPNWTVRWLGVNGLNNIIITGSASNALNNGRFILKNKNTGETIELVLNRLGRVRQA